MDNLNNDQNEGNNMPPPPYQDTKIQIQQPPIIYDSRVIVNTPYSSPPAAPILNNNVNTYHRNHGAHCHTYPNTKYPATLFCIKCNKYVNSIIRHEKGESYKRNIMIIIILCIICPPFLCVLPILCLTNALLDTIHMCPECNSTIGIHLAG